MVSKLLSFTAPLVASLALTGCVTEVADIGSVRNHPKEASVIYTSPVRNSATPLSKPLACFGDKMKAAGRKPLGIAIGDVKDYTGKQGQDEGFAITQGGALMAYSALGKMGPAVRVHERFDTRIAEAELVYMNQRQLGDGQHHSVDDPNTGGQSSVPWKPYFGGTIRQSDYFIVGGVTELNYNIQSGGAELAVSNVGPKARRYTMNIAVDLRIVGTQTLMVYDTVSVEKQLTGYEVGVGVFRFFGSNLFDINVGTKSQEPLQLGVRTAIEAGVLQLVASVAGVNPTPCFPPELGPAKWDGANAAAVHAAAKQELAQPLPPPVQPSAPKLAYAEEEKGNKAVTTKVEEIQDLQTASISDRSATPSGGEYAVIFASGQDKLDDTSSATMEQVASLAKNGRSVNLTVSGRDASELTAEARTQLHEARMKAVVIALMRHGVSRGDARVLWRASQTPVLASAAGGVQEIARIRIG